MKVFPRSRSGFTLAEMMLTLGLVALIYTMISTILVQVSRYVKNGRQVARQRHEMLKAVESLRYQLRSLYYPTSGAGLLGARTPVEAQDSLRFLTTNGRVHNGVVETGYRIQEYVDEESPERNGASLYYREFPFRRKEFRTLDPHQESPWKLYLRNVDVFELEYSSGGNTFQREWDTPAPPRTIRVRLERGGESRDRIQFEVTPGVGAQRW